MFSFLESSSSAPPAELWLGALAYVFGGILAGLFVSKVASRILKKLSSKTKNRVDDIVLAVTEKPLVFILTIAGFRLGIEHLSLEKSADAFVDKAYYILVAIAVAWVITRIADAIIQEYVVPAVEKTEGDLDDQLLPIVRKAIKVIVWGIALLMGFKNAGYDVGAIMAGFGIGGAAIAFAAKDTLSNFFGSVAVFVDKPFKIGDRIKIAGVDGSVVDIGIRTSRIKTLDNRIVTIPNSTFASSPIENVSSEPSTKVVEVLELSYANEPALMERALGSLRAIGHESIEESPLAGVSGFTETAIKVTFVFYVKKGADYLATLDAVNGAALRALRAEGVEFAAARRVLVANTEGAGR
ncbi:MAG: mechanosensitive ion channel family protein [Spirochaetaceae bacterium]|nr:mechanosensitive ion channel family protein [Spirochaetaceae bacterium]